MLNRLTHGRVHITLTDQKGWFVDALTHGDFEALDVECIDRYLYGASSLELFAILRCRDGARLIARTDAHSGPEYIEIIGLI